MKGTWLLPTRGRPHTLARFLQAAVATGMTTPGMILYSEVSDIVGVELPANWTAHMTHAQGMGDKFREIWPVVRHMDWVGWVVDDLVPETQGWDKTLIGALDGTNVISCNDGARAPHRMGAPVFSGDLLRAVGYIYQEGFWHAYADDMWERLGRATDTWWVNMDVVLRHHDAFQTGVADATHSHSYGRMDADRAALLAWRKTEMDAAVKRVMAMKAAKQEPERKVANA